MFQVIEVNTLEELQTYRLAWNDLWQRGRSQRFTLSFDWLETYFRQLEQADRPRRSLKVMVVVLAGKVIGMLPLTIKRARTRLGNLRVLTYPLDSWGNWYGPIGPNSAATLTASLRHLSKSKRDWDLLDLPYTDRDRFDLGRTMTAARNMGWPVTERLAGQVPVITLPESWADFLAAKREAVLDEILRAEQVAGRFGALTLQRYRSGPTADETAKTELLSCWRELLTESNRQAEFPLFEKLAHSADEAGQLDLAVCSINNRPAAASLGFVDGSRVELVRSISVCREGFGIERLLPHQLDSVLLGQLLEDGLIRGDESYEINAACDCALTAQTLWSTELINSFRYTMASWTRLRGALLVKYHHATSPRVNRKPQPTPQVPSALFPNTSANQKSKQPQLKVFG